jgi:myo-inositol 2-dehydrogenase / D-chiro-inositol 1-dehydrogenase
MELTMTNQIRVGILGLGEVSQLMHLPILADNDHKYVIKGVFDVSASAMEHVCGRYSTAVAYESAEALVASDDIDAVFILTPDSTHSGFLEMAVKADKHVFLEKPACLTVGELDAAIPLANQSDGTVFVAYMRRYARPFLKAKDLMPEQGDIRTVRVRDLICEGPFFIGQSRRIHYPNDIDPAIISASREATDTLLNSVAGADAPAALKRAYQVLTGLSSHSLSAMRELIGLPKRVISATYRQNGESIVALLDYGHFVAVYEAMIDNIARFEARIDVLSDHQHLEVSYDTPYIRNLPVQLKVTNSTDSETETTVHGPDYLDPFQVELDVFHKHITEGTSPKTSLEDSREDLVLLAQIVEAMKRS